MTAPLRKRYHTNNKGDDFKRTVGPKETIGLKRIHSGPRTLHQQEAEGYANGSR